MTAVSMVVNLDMCVGCFACQNACKVVNDLPPGVQWLKVHPTYLKPEEVNGKLYMDRFPIPVTLETCAECPDIKDGKEPLCASVCCGKALFVGKTEEALKVAIGKRAVVYTSKE